VSALRPAFAAVLLAAVLSRAACQALDGGEGSWGDRYRSGDDSAQSLPSLTQLRLEDFESATAAAWLPRMSINDGVAETRIAPIAESGSGRALGLRVLFMRRSVSTLDLRPSRPIRIDGRCVGLAVSAYGSGFPHELRLLVLDYYGVEHELSLGKLDFRGWRRLEAAIPLLDRGGSAYVQDDRHFRDQAGLRVSGLRIAFDLEESYGQYLAYFDDLGALIDGAGEGPVEPDDAATRSSAAPGAATRVADEGAVGPAAGAGDPPAEARMLVLGEIERKLAAAMTYPEAARLRGIEGTIALAFRVDKRGSLVSARIVKGSGSDILDRAGIELLRAAFPVDNDSGFDLDLEIPISFRLDGARRD
jgi:TonB family protein